MIPLRIHLAPDVPSLEALGLEDAAAFLEGDPPAPRAVREETGGDSERWRLPLPGTPERAGDPFPEAPRGAGTGWIVLERWRGAPLGLRLAARFGQPRSGSPAERRWNVVCHLRAHGVSAPEPLAVGARGTGLGAHDSFLVTRALDAETQRLDRWFAAGPDAAEIELAASALAGALAALESSGAVLPALDARGLWLRFPHHGGEVAGAQGDPGCGLSQIARWREEHALGGLTVDPRPAVLVTGLAGGRLSPRPGAAAAEALRERLRRSLGAGSGDDAARAALLLQPVAS